MFCSDAVRLLLGSTQNNTNTGNSKLTALLSMISLSIFLPPSPWKPSINSRKVNSII